MGAGHFGQFVLVAVAAEKPYNRAGARGNAPLLPPSAASPPEGEILAALSFVQLMKLDGKRRADFPLRGKYRRRRG